MQTISHLFLLDPLPSLNLALDSSLRMMRELTHLGHTVYACEPRQLSWRLGAKVAEALCTPVSFPQDAEHPVVGSPLQRRPLDSFQALHMRKDPPFDMDYVATTWLLDSAAEHCRIYNAPQALRSFNEKLSISRFKGDAKPALLSADPEELLAFLVEQAHGDAVIKPLDLFGGRGVARLSLQGANTTNSDAQNREDLLKQLRVETQEGHRMRLIQAFDPAVFDGEVRVFTAFGEPLAWCLKRPGNGSFLANTRAGARLEAYAPRAAEVERVSRVARSLLKEGVALVGFDLIGGYLSEINLTSPRLLTAPGDQNNYYIRLAELFARDLQG